MKKVSGEGFAFFRFVCSYDCPHQSWGCAWCRYVWRNLQDPCYGDMI